MKFRIKNCTLTDNENGILTSSDKDAKNPTLISFGAECYKWPLNERPTQWRQVAGRAHRPRRQASQFGGEGPDQGVGGHRYNPASPLLKPLPPGTANGVNLIQS